jgi:colanic acid biosynthesis glycosyl transferase WcaI
MRILFVNQYYPPDASASAYLLGELSEDLANEHDVWVVAGRPSYSPGASSYRPRGVHVERSWSTSFDRVSMAGRVLNYASFLLTSLTRALTVPRPDVVVGMTDPPVIGLVALLTARRFRSPFVYVCQDVFPDVAVALKRADNPLAVWLWRRLNALLRSRAAKVVVVGRDMAEKLRDEGVSAPKIEFIPNWANEPHVSSEDRTEARREMGWEDRYVVLHGGNVGLAQNLGTLVDAANRLRDEERIQFVILGDGAARADLTSDGASQGLSNLHFLPYRPKHEAEALLASADLQVISLAPGLKGCAVPSKVYGIMALGLPFVAAVEENSEIDRLIKEHNVGIRVDPGDGAGLAGAVAAMAGGAVDAASMAANGRAAFERAYSRPMVTDRYRLLLESLLRP